jgi:transcriptional regulator GlxA family with amidase domain
VEQITRRADASRAIRSRREVVESAEAYVRAHLGCPVPVARLCAVLGLSERGLRNAFYVVHGVGPKRWMQAERLHRARRALAESTTGRTSVTGVATTYGFYELGRFAAVYRRAFGEAPSETLRAQIRHSTSTEVHHERAS